MTANTRPQLTISLLASDRPDTIRRCLDSLQPILEAIPSELILVDTSGNSRIREILLEYTDQVYPFKWCQDFAKARNVGLKKAKGEWFLYLDDDEWFVETEDIIRFFQSGEYKKYGFANYQIRNFVDPEYRHYSDCWVSRMIRIDKDTEFRSKIHEYFAPLRGERKDLYALANHSGYIYRTEEEIRAHFERNSSLLMKMISEEPHHLRWQVQLVQEYHGVKEWEMLIDYCKDRIEQTKTINEPYKNIQIGTFYAGYVNGYFYQKKYEECLEIGCWALQDSRNAEYVKAFLYLRLAESTFRLSRWDQAVHYVQMYLKEFGSIEGRDVELMDHRNALLTGDAFRDSNLKKMYSIFICCDLQNGSIRALQTYYDKLEWDQNRIYILEGMEKFLVDAMATMEYTPVFSRIVTDTFSNRELRELMRKEVRRWELKNADAFNKIMYVFSESQSNDWYIWYMRGRLARKNKDHKGVEESMQQLMENLPNILMIPNAVYEIASEYGLNVTSKWKTVSANQWKENIKEYLAGASVTHLELTKEIMKSVFATDEWRYVYFELVAAERVIADGAKELWNPSAYYDTLQEYAETCYVFYKQYYKEEVFTTIPEALPQNVQAALKIKEYIQMEKTDKLGAIQKLREAGETYPKFAKGICKFLEQYAELEKQREQNRKKELRTLRDQVVAQIYKMLEKGQAQEALSIVTQLKQMVPDDLEVIALGLQTRLAVLEG